MKFLLLALMTVYCFKISAFTHLSDVYTVTFGDSKAEVKVIEYFSFNCSHCLSIYREDFARIKEKYIDTGKAFWVFHPVPMDKLTVQAIDCLARLSPKDKQIFLEGILEIISGDDSSVLYFQKAMELFGKPHGDLRDKKYLLSTRAFKDAFDFIKQEDKVSALPSVSINGQLYLTEVPNFAFIAEKIEKKKESL